MTSGFLITLREGLEASLIVAILLTYLGKTGRRHEARFVWFGTGAAAAACAIAGTLLFALVDGLHGTAEYAVEGTIALAATAVLTHMVFWMRRNARTMSAELRTKVDRASTATLVTIAFVAVAREGLETALFLLGAGTSNSSGEGVLVGGALGLATAAVIGAVVFAGGRTLNLSAFFNVTAVLLLLFAAGLAGKAVHEFIELASLEESVLGRPVWTIERGIWASGTFYDFVRGLFGWSRNPERATVAAWGLYAVPVAVLYFRGPRRTSPDPVATAVAAR